MAGIDPNRLPLQERAVAEMSPDQYKRAIKKLGLSQVRAARFFGVSDRHGQRMATGHVEIPPSVAHLLKLMLKYEVTPGELDRRFAD